MGLLNLYLDFTFQELYIFMQLMSTDKILHIKFEGEWIIRML